MKINTREWTQEQDDRLMELYANNATVDIADALGKSVASVYNRAYIKGLKKSIAYLQTEKSGRLNDASSAGVATQFNTGHTPFNKGKQAESYLSPQAFAKIKTTCFKPGHLPANTKSDGDITIRTDNKDRHLKQYYFIRIAIGKWQHLHRYLWQQEYGPIPSGKVVVFKDRNTLNCTLANLELISREENMLRNTIQRYPLEIQEVMKLSKKLQRKVHQYEK